MSTTLVGTTDVDGLEPLFALHRHALATGRALLAESGGDHAQAAAGFADSAERWERFEVPWERVQAALGLGRSLIGLGRAAQAAASLRTAREIFASLGAAPALRETDSLLE